MASMNNSYKQHEQMQGNNETLHFNIFVTTHFMDLYTGNVHYSDDLKSPSKKPSYEVFKFSRP